MTASRYPFGLLLACRGLAEYMGTQLPAA